MYEMLQRLTWMRWTGSKVAKWRRERSIDWERTAWTSEASCCSDGLLRVFGCPLLAFPALPWYPKISRERICLERGTPYDRRRHLKARGDWAAAAVAYAGRVSIHVQWYWREVVMKPKLDQTYASTLGPLLVTLYGYGHATHLRTSAVRGHQ